MRKLLLVIVFILFSSPAQAITILDQVSPYTNAQFNVADTPIHWQQEVVVGIGGTLTGIDLYADVAGGVLNFSINRGNGWQSDIDDIFLPGLQLAIGWGWNAIDLSSHGFTLAAGETFVIGLEAIGIRTGVTGSAFPGMYTPGDLYFNGSFFQQPDEYDIAFRTYMESTPIPEPSTWLLLGIGLVGITIMSIRKKLTLNRGGGKGGRQRSSDGSSIYRLSENRYFS